MENGGVVVKKIVAMLVLLMVFSAVSAVQSYAFSDVKKDAYYKEAVDWAVEHKVVSGFPDGTFKPNQKVTFDQFIKMYTNTYDFKKDNPKTYKDYYEVLEQYKIVFDADEVRGHISRGDVSVLMGYAAGEIPEYDYYDYLSDFHLEGAQYMLATTLSTGQNKGKDATKIFGSANTLTRAQAVTFLFRATQLGLTKIADDIRYIVEPPMFDLYDEVLRSYDMGDGIVYYVMNHENATLNYEVLVTVNGAHIGGYIAIPGDDTFGYTIGERYQDDYEMSYFTLIPHIDKHNNNEVRAVSYYYNNSDYYDSVFEAMALYKTEALDNVAQLYADLANEFRAKNGVPSLQVHSVLTKAAKGHSVDMATRNYFDHQSLDGLSDGDRIDNAGGIANMFGWGENISAGRNSVFESHTAWINSLGHRENLLRERYTHIGYGAGYNKNSDYRTYYTTKFAMIRE